MRVLLHVTDLLAVATEYAGLPGLLITGLGSLGYRSYAQNMPEGTIASLTPTLCGLFGVASPALATEPRVDTVRRQSEATLGDKPVERCLLFCPDALGDHLWSRFPDRIGSIEPYCPIRVRLKSIVPPITPVCFASVFTGGQPEGHGIREPKRPVLTCDTLFDAFIRADKRMAIVAVRNSSIDLMYRNRAVDYFSEPYDEQVADRVQELLERDTHELIVAYQQEYDDQLHATEPFSPTCIAAFDNHLATLDRLGRLARSAWAGRPHAIVVTPDHGAHLDDETGHGTHGLDIAADMEVSHWYGLFAS